MDFLHKLLGAISGQGAAAPAKRMAIGGAGQMKHAATPVDAALAKLLGMGVAGGARGAMQHAQYAQYKNPDGSGGGFGPNNPSLLRVGGRGLPVQGVEGFAPQDTYGRGELDTNNYLQPSYQNPQAGLNGMYQQNAQNPLPFAADPLGWRQGGQAQIRVR